MWKPEHRRAAERRGLRYPSDMTDEEWALVAPLIPPAKRGGRKRSVNAREVLNAGAVRLTLTVLRLRRFGARVERAEWRRFHLNGIDFPLTSSDRRCGCTSDLR